MPHMDQLKQTLNWKMSHNGTLSSFLHKHFVAYLRTCYHILTETCATKLMHSRIMTHLIQDGLCH